MNIEFLNLLGSVTALIIYSLCILIFIFRLLKNPGAENLLGIIFIFTAIPLLYLLYSAFVFPRPFIYYIQIILMLAYIIIELFVDYILNVNFRKTRWMVIVYVMFFLWRFGRNDRDSKPFRCRVEYISSNIIPYNDCAGFYSTG